MAAKNQNTVVTATQKTEPGAKKDALATALAQIEKQFGKGAVMKLGDNAAMQVEAISTGSLGLDMALGVGGVPRGRIVEVYGPESSGKTTLALHILAEAQKQGGEVAFIDVEHALDPVYAEALGVDINNLLVSQPDTGEQAMEICEALVRSGAIDAIVVDSVPRRDRGRDGRQPRRPAGPPDEPGHAQTDQCHWQDQHGLRLHQPAA
jgi:recombination protein RecA